ncbi:hypothetical protein ACYU03_12150 [Pseudomonas sp. X10]
MAGNERTVCRAGPHPSARHLADTLICPYNLGFLEVQQMRARFVTVPAVPILKESSLSGARFRARTEPGSFDIYDNQEKVRLTITFKSRAEAQAECDRKNSELK